MTDEVERLSGDDLEQFFKDHGGRQSYKIHQEASKPTGSRIDTWSDGFWRLQEDPSVPMNDIEVYRHKGPLLPVA